MPKPKVSLDDLRMSQLLNHRKQGIYPFLLRVFFILVGDLVGAVAINNFLVPARILAGGVTGIAQLIHHFWNLPIGTLYFLFNIPLFLLGYKYLGRRFIVLTGIGIIGFSVFTDTVHLHLHVPANDPLLMGLYGGVMLGIGSGLVFRAGGSTGGTDIVSLVIHRIKGLSVGAIGFALNVVVVFLSLGVFGLEAGMYTLVSMFASSRVINAILHYQHRKTALIVSSRAAEISKEIGAQLGRGSTLLNAAGSYTHQPTSVLMCALTHLELTELKALATEIDPQVFITILDTTEVIGKFRNLPV